MKRLIAVALLGFAAAGAWAERADAGKQAVIEYDNGTADQVAQTSTISGNVIVTKGTLVLRAEKAVLKQTPEDDMVITLTAGAGKPATFRQKRDGGPNLWVEGEAQRIEYDERTGVMKLFGNAKIRQTEDGNIRFENQSEFISYDSLREVLVSHNEPNGASKVGGGRGRIIIAPRKARPGAPAPATPPAPASAP